jgi:hypothetical protein
VPRLISKAAYSRLRGLSHVLVAKQVRQGLIPTVNGMIDPDAADRARAANLAGGGWGGKRDGRAANTPADPAQASLAASRAKRAMYDAETARIEFLILTGKLVRADDVRARAFAKGRAVRDRLLSIPDRVGPIVAALDDPAEIEALLVREIEEALRPLATE